MGEVSLVVELTSIELIICSFPSQRVAEDLMVIIFLSDHRYNRID